MMVSKLNCPLSNGSKLFYIFLVMFCQLRELIMNTWWGFPFIFYQVVVEGNENDSHVSLDNEGKQGELQVCGPSVFKWWVHSCKKNNSPWKTMVRPYTLCSNLIITCENFDIVNLSILLTSYWNKPKETQESFTTDGWFKTGDTAGKYVLVTFYPWFWCYFCMCSWSERRNYMRHNFAKDTNYFTLSL